MEPKKIDALSDVERVFLWVGLAGGVLVFIGLAVSHLLPPPSPGEGSAQVAAFYRAHAGEIRWGTILMGLGAAALAPWFGVITRQLYRIDGHGPATAYCQLALAALLVFEIVLPITLLQVVVFRPDRPVGDTLLLSDLSLILLISPAYTVIIEWVVTGLAIVRDRSARPVFPR